eukprot:3830530-Pyramimonas_sp.AAC.1
MVRIRNWAPPEGEDAITQISPCIKPQLKTILDDGIYESVNMKTGADSAYLKKMVPTLVELFTLDPRGAYFLQSDVRRAISVACSEKEFKSSLHKLSMTMKLTEYATLERVAYSIR